MKYKTHYDTLEVSRQADAQEIKKSYRNLTLVWHPDRNPGNMDAEERFKNIVLAYEVLSDPDRRMAYDLGFVSGSGLFDPGLVDVNLLDPEEFIRTFATLFGDYLDAHVPGGFRDRVTRAAEGAQRFDKKSKTARPGSGTCKTCNGTERVPVRQGGYTVYVGCRSCRSKESG